MAMDKKHDPVPVWLSNPHGWLESFQEKLCGGFRRKILLAIPLKSFWASLLDHHSFSNLTIYAIVYRSECASLHNRRGVFATVGFQAAVCENL